MASRLLRESAAEHLDMPRYIENDVKVPLPVAARKIYDDFERELFAELEQDKLLVGTNAGGKYMICRQLANGGCYMDDDFGGRTQEIVHYAKIEAAADLVEGLGGEPVVIAYQFHHDLTRLKQRWPNATALADKKLSRAELNERWNKRQIPILLVQCQALSHGANLQYGGHHIIWIGLTDELEIFLQLNGRLYRQGQPSDHVCVHKIVAQHTVDEAISRRLKSKDKRQDALLRALRAYQLEKRGNACRLKSK